MLEIFEKKMYYTFLINTIGWKVNNLFWYIRHDDAGTQSPNSFFTNPDKQMQAGVPHLGMQLITFNLSHLCWQPSSPQPEYIWFAFVHENVALNIIKEFLSNLPNLFLFTWN